MIRALATTAAVALALTTATAALAAEYNTGTKAPQGQPEAAQPGQQRTLGDGGQDPNIPIAPPSTATTRFPDIPTGSVDLDRPPQQGDRDEGAPEQAETPAPRPGQGDSQQR